MGWGFVDFFRSNFSICLVSSEILPRLNFLVLIFFGEFLAGFYLPTMGFIGPTQLGNEGDAYAGNRHRVEKDANKLPLITNNTATEA